MSGRSRALGIILAVVLTASLGAGTLAADATDPQYAQQDRARYECKEGRVALTFDDGPQRGVTGKLLRVLRRKHVVATFFVQGYLAEAYPRLIRRMAGNRHRIGNHSWNHRDLTELSKRRIRRQLAKTNRAVKRAGAPRPTLVRPPYGATNRKVTKVAHKLDLHQVLWSDDTKNWSGESVDEIVHRALHGLRPGDNIVLLHDGSAYSERTVEAVPRIVHGIRKRDYCVAPLDRNGDPRRPYNLLWPTHW